MISLKKIKKEVFRSILYPIGETFGIPRWVRRPAASKLDEKLAKYLNYKNGIFVEAGANNGLSQSNTFFLEKALKWKGILVEGIPELYSKCKKNRRGSKVFHAGLVPKDYKKSTLKMNYANLMSVAEGAMKPHQLKKHIQEGLEVQKIERSYTVEIPAMTFEKILDEAGYLNIDFLSIDLEGFEIEALKGWNFEKYRPKFILIEVRDLNEVDSFFSVHDYKREALLSHHDYLYRDNLPPKLH